eukprot:1152575-Pelagomonas_calceolata.AAC.1
MSAFTPPGSPRVLAHSCLSSLTLERPEGRLYVSSHASRLVRDSCTSLPLKALSYAKHSQLWQTCEVRPQNACAVVRTRNHSHTDQHGAFASRGLHSNVLKASATAIHAAMYACYHVPGLASRIPVAHLWSPGLSNGTGPGFNSVQGTASGAEADAASKASGAASGSSTAPSKYAGLSAAQIRALRTGRGVGKVMGAHGAAVQGGGFSQDGEPLQVGLCSCSTVHGVGHLRVC